MYLLDTDTIIYSLKGHEGVTAKFRQHRMHSMAISVITYGELIFGAERSARRTENIAKARRVADLYRVVAVDRIIMEVFGRLKSDLRQDGKTVADFDLLIGATALSEGLTLVTNNLKHFEKIPSLALESWAR